MYLIVIQEKIIEFDNVLTLLLKVVFLQCFYDVFNVKKNFAYDRAMLFRSYA